MGVKKILYLSQSSDRMFDQDNRDNLSDVSFHFRQGFTVTELSRILEPSTTCLQKSWIILKEDYPLEMRRAQVTDIDSRIRKHLAPLRATDQALASSYRYILGLDRSFVSNSGLRF